MKVNWKVKKIAKDNVFFLYYISLYRDICALEKQKIIICNVKNFGVFVEIKAALSRKFSLSNR